ncbi:hypothetical protein MAP00_005035 [Monascus purpureus]|nr:hypothetical protein MAP00_005035 [Monascus purpureus]
MSSGNKRPYSQLSGDDDTNNNSGYPAAGPSNTFEQQPQNGNNISSSTSGTTIPSATTGGPTPPPAQQQQQQQQRQQQQQQNTGELAAKRRKPRRKKGEPEENYSEIARQKTQNARRTGQACDRCQVRKLACDSNPLGCSKCVQAGLTCYTTDRATGHTRERGELERLREENTRLGAENEQLRRQIAGISLYAQSLMGILTQQGMPVPAPQQDPIAIPQQQQQQPSQEQLQRQHRRVFQREREQQLRTREQRQRQDQQLWQQSMPQSRPQHGQQQQYQQIQQQNQQLLLQPMPQQQQLLQQSMAQTQYQPQPQQYQQGQHLQVQQQVQQGNNQAQNTFDSSDSSYGVDGSRGQQTAEDRERNHQPSPIDSLEVRSDVLQGQEQVQRPLSIPYSNNAGLHNTYPIPPQSAPAIHAVSTSSNVSYLPGANAMPTLPNAIPASGTAAITGSSMPGYPTPPAVTDQTQSQRQGDNSVRQQQGNTNSAIPSSSFPSMTGFYSNNTDTQASTTWALDGNPGQIQAPAQQVYTSQQTYDGQQTQNITAATTYAAQQLPDNQQVYAGQQSHNVQQGYTQPAYDATATYAAQQLPDNQQVYAGQQSHNVQQGYTQPAYDATATYTAQQIPDPQQEVYGQQTYTAPSPQNNDINSANNVPQQTLKVGQNYYCQPQTQNTQQTQLQVPAQQDQGQPQPTTAQSQPDPATFAAKLHADNRNAQNNSNDDDNSGDDNSNVDAPADLEDSEADAFADLDETNDLLADCIPSCRDGSFDFAFSYKLFSPLVCSVANYLVVWVLAWPFLVGDCSLLRIGYCILVFLGAMCHLYLDVSSSNG